MLSKLKSRRITLIDRLSALNDEQNDLNEKIVKLDTKLNLINMQTSDFDDSEPKGDAAEMIIESAATERIESEEEYNTCLATLIGHSDSVECLDFESPTGILVSGSADSSIRVWSLTAKSCVGVLSGHTGYL